MKGPYERLKYDLNRIWECPHCHHRERAPGTVTYLWCKCQHQKGDQDPVQMKLVDDAIRRVTPEA